MSHFNFLRKKCSAYDNFLARKYAFLGFAGFHYRTLHITQLATHSIALCSNHPLLLKQQKCLEENRIDEIQSRSCGHFENVKCERFLSFKQNNALKILKK